ncbi:hypothetical protein NDI37_22360 [Funiculus sociatus GB2-A5]|uniref:Uncharacterized protein n=1 Tax=Funiculus sociatus GB2-A5 TaxID=2933946 RepID=A0ABV0JUQ5_9CYAN|nr:MULTISPECIES: hypothetical protein [unclassified Trichocoleus]MBD1907974.1 hypothetical protein [Trichocoleus sp. FACHB-832]MBD2065115.1 hypothetical protein [Trichocoleus sp. FACHB-6]
MKTLITLFGKERNQLETEIDKATNLEQVVQLVQNRLDNLERNYIGELSVAQVRLASFFLDTLRQSIATLTAANETRISQPQPEKIVKQVRGLSNSLILKVLQGLISISILGSLFSLTQDTVGAWMDILLMTVLVGLEVVFQLEGGGENLSDSPQPVAPPKLITQVDSKAFLDNLGDALNTIDLAVASAEQVKKPLDGSGIEELPELLNVVQRLTGASFLQKPQMALELTKLLPQILMEQGIRTQIYQPGDKHSGREYFDFEPSIDPEARDYVTITPALLKGDHLLRRGRVVEPAYSETRE